MGMGMLAGPGASAAGVMSSPFKTMSRYDSLAELLGIRRKPEQKAPATETPADDPWLLLRPDYLDIDGLARDLEHQVVFENGRWIEKPVDPAKRKVALAISGGGAAGAYCAGVIEALVTRLKERGIEIDLLVGTSAGALNAYGVLLESLGMANSQIARDPDLQQPYSSFIASIWSYLDRHRKTSTWIVGRRAWIVALAGRGASSRWLRLAFGLLLAALVLALNPFLLFAVSLLVGLEGWWPAWLEAGHALNFTALGVASLLFWLLVAGIILRRFRYSLFRDVPLLRLLANTGPGGDLSRPWFWSREKTVDRARVLSRRIVEAWYKDDRAPELILTATDISLGRECLFTLVRPRTYRRLAQSEWVAVQFDSGDEASRPYRREAGSLFALGENFLQSIAGSTAVPGAFPAQQIGLYGPGGRHEVRHVFVDGGVLNNSPVHIAIDAGATHMISLEVEPLGRTRPLDVDDRKQNYNLLGTAIETFAALLELSTSEDIRRTVTWNRFLAEHPEVVGSLEAEPNADDAGPNADDAEPNADDAGPNAQDAELNAAKVAEPADAPSARRKTTKRIIPLYRVAPAKREIGTVEFDGHYEDGRCVVTLRDWLRRGYVDMQGRHIWRATLETEPKPETPASDATS